jgi:hypothetical protein
LIVAAGVCEAREEATLFGRWCLLCERLGVLSQTLDNPTEEHIIRSKHVLRYVAGTLDHGVTYSRKGERRLNWLAIVMQILVDVKPLLNNQRPEYL